MTDFISGQFKKYKNEHLSKQNITDEKKDKIEIIRQIIFFIVGIMNIIFASLLREKLPMIIGFASIITGTISFIKNMIKKEYETLETMKIPRDIVISILGIIILLKKENAIPFIAIAWGILGLLRGSKELNVAVYNKVHKKTFLLELVHSVLELVFSMLLIFDPFEKIEEHLVLLGIEMVIGSLKICFKDKLYESIEE